jgi:hypothetical protein
VRAYQPIWERIRANPGKLVPIEVPAAFVARVMKAVEKEKHEDIRYRNVRKSQGKQGIVYRSREPHPSKPGIVRLIFILREFAIIHDSSFKNPTGNNYLVRNPPPISLNEDLAFVEIPSVAYNFTPTGKDIYASINWDSPQGNGQSIVSGN